MYYDFQTTTYGKWILTGEHAVIRGYAALVFPIMDKQLTLSYRQSSSTLQADYAGESGADMRLLFWSVLEQGMQLVDHSLQQVSGHFHIQCNIPIGVGMGASAALCVAVARWFVFQGLLIESNIYTFAKQLENLFHGKSSGVDIAGVSATNTGIYFQQDICNPLELAWQPQWCLSSCGQMGITAHCIQKVQTLWQTDADYARSLDETMHASVNMARSALVQMQANSQTNLAQAINQAADCFHRWGLVSESLQHHMQHLREAGAIAVKPTGSGGGGYVVSLWNNLPQLPQVYPIYSTN